MGGHFHPFSLGIIESIKAQKNRKFCDSWSDKDQTGKIPWSKGLIILLLYHHQNIYIYYIWIYIYILIYIYTIILYIFMCCFCCYRHYSWGQWSRPLRWIRRRTALRMTWCTNPLTWSTALSVARGFYGWRWMEMVRMDGDFCMTFHLCVLFFHDVI